MSLNRSFALLLVVLAGSSASIPAAVLPSASKIDFSRDIQPIFAERCYSCHGPEKQKGGLRLDRKADALKGGDSGKVIIPGQSALSLLISNVAGLNPETVMPPKGERLSSDQIVRLRAWIDEGAIWSDLVNAQEGRSSHWAFRKPERPALPAVHNRRWVRNPIDAFVLNRLERQGFAPAPEADKVTLIRRLSFDLLGLPPSAEDVQHFVADTRPEAYDELVECFLASPQFGERWARHWLDFARYADSDGYEKDGTRPYAYLYRDWVIEAINRDMPFDQFSILQIAGDLLPDAALPQKTATGFHRQTLTNKEGGVDQEEFRCKATVDRATTTAAIWLGLTVGCAECHSHKYDPISQKEFYQFYAFFNNATEKDLVIHQDDLTKYNRDIKRWDKQALELTNALNSYLTNEFVAAQAHWEATVVGDNPEVERQNQADDSPSPPSGKRAGLPAEGSAKVGVRGQALDSEIKAILRIPAVQRDTNQVEQVTKFFREKIDPRARKLDSQIAAHVKKQPKPPEMKAAILVENDRPRPTHIHIRGDFLRPGEEVEPAVFSILHRLKPRGVRADRFDLAQWLFDPANPLTGRVSVNHIWLHLFGRGLVNTVNDFGTRGEPPSNPELLDWLATEFPRLGWSRKALIRLIVTSATYRQSSAIRPELFERDPNNILLARQNRFRLEAEVVRDSFLACSGLLVPRIGGPSIRPPLPPDIAAIAYANQVKWPESSGADRYRRGLYIFLQRTIPYPMLVTFDAPDSNVTCTRRERSNTPLQALTLLNDTTFFECAQVLGHRSPLGQHSTPAEQIGRLFQVCLGRSPTAEESSRLLAFYNEERRLTAADPEMAAKVVGNPRLTSIDVPDAATQIALARTIMNLDEFLTRE